MKGSSQYIETVGEDREGQDERPSGTRVLFKRGEKRSVVNKFTAVDEENMNEKVELDSLIGRGRNKKLQYKLEFPLHSHVSIVGVGMIMLASQSYTLVQLGLSKGVAWTVTAPGAGTHLQQGTTPH